MKLNLRSWFVAGILLLAAFVAIVFWYSANSPRSRAAQSALALSKGLAEGNQDTVRSLVKIPLFLTQKSPTEQGQLLVDLLSSEITPEGLAALKRDGLFGPLRQVFPAEADAWAAAFAVQVDDCVAFRMERLGLRAELVLLRKDAEYMVLRCNNVRQMAGELSRS